MLIDSHAHLQDRAFRKDLPEVLQRAREGGLENRMHWLHYDRP